MDYQIILKYTPFIFLNKLLPLVDTVMGKRKLSTPNNPDVMSLETPSNDQTLDKVNSF